MLRIFALLIIFYLSACADKTIPMMTIFDYEDTVFKMGQGEFVVTGTAFLYDENMKKRTCAGHTTFIFPQTAYTDEFMQIIFGNNDGGFRDIRTMGEKVAVDNRFNQTARRVVCDNKGTFTFSNIKKGDYYILVDEIWNTNNGPTGGSLMTKISIENDNLSVELTRDYQRVAIIEPPKIIELPKIVEPPKEDEYSIAVDRPSEVSKANEPKKTPINVAFNSKMAASKLKDGVHSISGSAFLRQKGGGVVTCAGSEVVLTPKTPYADEYIHRFYRDNDSGYKDFLVQYLLGDGIEVNPEYYKYTKTATCDAQGNFKFSKISNGDYYITTTVIWEAPGLGVSSTQGGYLMKRVTVDNENVNVIITY